ncbi:hypothetical protein LCGC14_0549280 [marine sediment metagenome]|uniref:Uncharacterized protein n=1 Tax=marine sediment metagenome TaxID=412755 RepID=A0A0F9RVB2_9ZZZZ
MIERTNPFKSSSQRYRVFEFMKKGRPHSIKDITVATWGRLPKVWYGEEANCRRHTTSVLRHIRYFRGDDWALDVWYDRRCKTYRLIVTYPLGIRY